MKKIIIFFSIFFFLFLFNISKAHADWQLRDQGRMFYFAGKYPPQITTSGKIQNNYTSDSMFPLGMFFTDLGNFGPLPASAVCATTDRGENCRGRDTAPELQDAGFNLSFPWWSMHSDAIISHLGDYGIKDEEDTQFLLSDIMHGRDNWTHFQSEITRVANNPNVFSIQLYDDQPCAWNDSSCQSNSAATIAQGISYIRQLAPNKLLVRSGGCGTDVDIAQPLRQLGIGSELDLAYAANFPESRTGCLDTQPVFPYIGAYNNWTAGGIRAQAYMAIIHGATGIWYFVQWSPWAWGSTTPFWRIDASTTPGINAQASPNQWNEVKKTNLEITANKKILLSPTATDDYHVYLDFTDNHPDLKTLSPIHTMLKNTGEAGTRYLIAVNTRNLTIKTKFTFPSFSFASATDLLGSSGSQVTSANEFTDTFPGYGVKLYKISSTATTSTPSPTTSPPPPANDPLPLGSYDADHWTSGCTVSGWTCDPSNYGASVPVNVYVDGTTPADLVVVSATASTVHSPSDPGPNNQCGGTAHDFSISNDVVRQALISAGLDPNVQHRYRPLALNIDSSGNTRVQDASGNWLTTWLNKYISDTATCVVPPTPTPTPLPVSGDINHDGKVNIQDYNQLLTDFGKTGSPGFAAADINNDGKVDIFDYNILVGNFRK